MTISDIIRNAGNLPAAKIVDDVNNALKRHDTLVVTAPPGAGKSTLLPLTILFGLEQAEGKLLMLEPRRIAARQVAERMATILNEPIGKTVGYRIRFDKKVSADTHIEVLTEGILTRMIVDDATLERVSVIVFDEFHERSINSDLALALARRCQQLIRPDLKIVIMSATIDANDICHELDAPLIKSEGRMFPVEMVYATDDIDRYDISKNVATTILRAHREHAGDILAFLPGQGEIQQCQDLIYESLGDTKVFPLYGNLSPKQQQQAIAPSHIGERKVVLATPVAETSLTIEGVKTVVDSGFCRKQVFDPNTGLGRLDTVRISMDMATQRSGRAGRVAEGTCYRLWTKISEHAMATQRIPEIVEADLASLLLDVAVFGEDVAQLPWLTPPPTANVVKARNLLQLLGAIDTDGEVTPLGKQMDKLPCHPRIARMMLKATTPVLKSIACDIAAILEEKDPLYGESDSDISLRISRLRHYRCKKALGGRYTLIERTASEYRRMLRIDEDNSDPVAEDIGALVAYAYPERVAMALDDIGTFRLANGVEVALDRNDPLASYEWIAIASMFATPVRKGKVFLAVPIDIDSVASELVTERDNVSWDGRQGCVVMLRERRIGKLVIESSPIHDAGRQLIIETICNAVRKEGLSMFDWSSIQGLQLRVAKVAEWHPEMDIPNISTEHLMDTATEWLPFYLEQDGRLKTTISDLKKINLYDVVWSLIPYDLQQVIDRLAPTHIQVPTGSRIKVDYRLGAELPVLSVRLQECFGMQDTPCVNDGKQPVLLELLSPGFKPVQLTQDLQSFWQNTYFEVRKELKRRYPKHYWPENPLEAEAVRGVKRR